MPIALAYSKLPHFGIVLDKDLSAPMSPAEQEEFRRLFLQHHLIIAHDQKLTPQIRVQLSESLGVGLIRESKEDPPISNVVKGGFLSNYELSWHADNSYTPHPVKAISLYAVDLVDGASSTMFCSGSLALQRMNADERQRLEKVEAFHVLSKTPDGRPRFDGDPKAPQAVHPVILEDPFVGPVLYVHYNTTDSIVGLGGAESDAMLQKLFDHIYAQDFVYEHIWRRGDFVLWSNVALQHARGKLGAIGNRTLARVAVQDVASNEMYPDYDFSRYIN